MNKSAYITGCCLLFASAYLHAASLWTDHHTVSAKSVALTSSTVIHPFIYRAISSNLVDIRQALSSSVNRQGKNIIIGIDIPLPDGNTEKFSVELSPVMEPQLAEKYPLIKTYKVRGIDSPASSGRVDVTPNGFHAFIYTDKGLVYIDPALNSKQGTTFNYKSYYKKDFVVANKHLASDFSCGTNSLQNMPMSFSGKHALSNGLSAKTTSEIHTYRIAIATTAEYSSAVSTGGANVPDTMAELAVVLNRVNGIFERDLAIQLVIVANNDQLIGLDPVLDGYSNINENAILDENQSIIDSMIGSANYDIGHVFSTQSGGLAAVGVVCEPGFKSQGTTGDVTPKGDDVFYVDFVAHELGHQFGANHSFNGTSEFCGDVGARNQATAFEPGSGNTIMSYAGICSGENIQANVDDNFHAGSIDEITIFSRSGAGNICAINAPSGNNSPSVNAGLDKVIPLATPFTLTGSATDPESDTLSFQWQQMDTGTATNSVTFGTDLGDNPLFKSFKSVSTGSRTFPQISTLLASVTDPAEVLPTTARTMNFRLLVKDGNGGVDSDNMQVRATAVAGPFEVLQPNSAVTLDFTQPQIVEWDSACTTQAPVNCANVDILLSTNGGTTFTTLAASVPNDGEQNVIFPSNSTSSGRIKIMCSDNVFFDVSDVNFTIANGVGGALTSTGNGGDSSVCAVEPVVRTGGGTVSIFILLGFTLIAGLRFRRGYC